MNFSDPDILGKIGQIVMADILLAGDNALIIALATRSLGPKQQFWGRMLGAGGAVALRILFVMVIGFMLKIPFVQLIGGLLLIWIAVKLVRPGDEAMEAAGAGGHAKTAASLRDAITMIIIADITMSLDNVIAIANIAKDRATGELDTGLVAFGLVLSIPLVVWGSTLITRLMTRFRWIVWLGGGILGHVSGSIIFHDHHVLKWMGLRVPNPGERTDLDALLEGASTAVTLTVRYLPWILAILICLYGWWWTRAQHAARRK